MATEEALYRSLLGHHGHRTLQVVILGRCHTPVGCCYLPTYWLAALSWGYTAFVSSTYLISVVSASILLMTGSCGQVEVAADGDGGLDSSIIDGSINDGSVPDAAIDGSMLDAAPISPNFVFLTSRTLTGDLGGLAGADATCNELAVAAGLDGTYVAWLSTETTNAIDRLGDASGWIRPDGLPFAATKEDIVAGRVFYPISVDETNTPFGIFGGGPVWTGTGPDGTFTGQNCDAWTDDGATTGQATLGSLYGGPTLFTSNPSWNVQCNGSSHLYCFGIDNQGIIEEPAAVGRIAFLSERRVAGNAGVAGMDAICQGEAIGAGLSGEFQAVVSDNNQGPSTRFILSGASWVRPDGVKIFESASDFGDSTSTIAPIAVTLGLEYINELVWTGASSFYNTSIGCTNWTSVTGSGTHAQSAMANSSSSSVAYTECETELRFYCLQN